MGSRTGLRARRDAEARRAFFEAAMELFREKGVDRTSVEEIAEKAGYSRATFFNHFGTKKGILRYYGQSLSEGVESLLAEADSSLSSLEQIHRVLLSLAREADSRKEDLKVVFFHSLTDPDYLMGPTAARTRIGQVLSDLVRKAQEEGLARRDLPPREMAFHILSLYHSAIFSLAWDLGDAESTMESAWRFMLTGVCGGDPAVG